MRLHIKILKLLCLPLVFLLRCFAYVIPRDRNMIAIGAWLGDLYADSSKYFVEYLLEHSDYRIFWIGKDVVRDRLPKRKNLFFVLKGSLYCHWILLRARTWVSCQGSWADLTSLPLYGNALIINLWHGIPLKQIGRLAPKNRHVKSSVFNRFSSALKVWAYGYTKEWISISSAKAGEIMVGGEPQHYSAKRLLPFGFVRNDFLIKNCKCQAVSDAFRRKYSKLLGYDPDKKVVLYMPTFRRPGCHVFSFYRLPESEQQRIKAALERENAVLIEKHHYLTYRDYPIDKPSLCSVVVPSSKQAEIDVQELYLAADIMISDYSGAIIDYGLLKRPAIHFAYDLEEYVNEDSGLAYDLRDVAVGPFVRTLEDLERVLVQMLRAPAFIPAPNYQELVAYEKGIAGECILEFINKKIIGE